MDIALFTPRDHARQRRICRRRGEAPIGSPAGQLQNARLIATGENCLVTFGRQFEDKELERWWYHNQYWLACLLFARVR